jgi:hypothetical protein
MKMKSYVVQTQTNRVRAWVVALVLLLVALMLAQPIWADPASGQSGSQAGNPEQTMADLHARNFADLLARHADEARGVEEVVDAGSDLGMAELHTRNFASLLAREADEVRGVEEIAEAGSGPGIAELHTRNFASLLAREADEAAAARRGLSMTSVPSGNYGGR